MVQDREAYFYTTQLYFGDPGRVHKKNKAKLPSAAGDDNPGEGNTDNIHTVWSA